MVPLELNFAKNVRHVENVLLVFIDFFFTISSFILFTNPIFLLLLIDNLNLQMLVVTMVLFMRI